MKTFAKIIGIGLGTVVGLIVLVVVASRFSDGPLVEMLPGGPFTTGEIVTDAPTDWSFLSDLMFVEFESNGRSRKSYIYALDGKAYVGASLGFPPFKTWHEEVLENPEAVLRVDGKRYPRRLQKIDDPAIEERLKEQSRQKYGGGPDPTSGTWFFRFDPPS